MSEQFHYIWRTYPAELDNLRANPNERVYLIKNVRLRCRCRSNFASVCLVDACAMQNISHCTAYEADTMAPESAPTKAPSSDSTLTQTPRSSTSLEPTADLITSAPTRTQTKCTDTHRHCKPWMQLHIGGYLKLHAQGVMQQFAAAHAESGEQTN